MKVYKATDKNMICNPSGDKPFQYEIGVTYEKPEAKPCEHGFHACEAPLDVLRYYRPGDGSRYFEAELEDVSPERQSEDTKVCGKKITLGAEIGIPGLVKAHVEYTRTMAEKGGKNGDMSNLAGDMSNLAGGDWSNLAGGNRSNLAGGYSSLVVGRNASKAKGGLHSVVVLTEWEWRGDDYVPVAVKAGIVDGKKLKSDTWYTLKDGEFVEVSE